MNIPEAGNTGNVYTPRGSSWNAMREQAMRGGKLSVAAPLTLRNSTSGTVITFEHPLVTLVLAVITGPVESGDAGRFLAKLIDGPIKPDASGDFSKDDLGKVPGGDKAVVVEAWNLSGGDLPTAMPVFGWHVGNRGDDLKGRQILLVPGGGSLPTPQYQDMVFQGVSQNQGGFDWLHTHAMESA